MADAIEGIYNLTRPALADGQQAECQLGKTGALRVSITGATNTSRILSAAASTNATSASAVSGTVVQITGYNAAASARYLKFYDKASAPTVGTDTPRKTLYLAPTAAFTFKVEDYYPTGIAYAITTAAADADTGALTAGDVTCLNVDFH